MPSDLRCPPESLADLQSTPGENRTRIECEPRDPNYEAEVRDGFAQQSVMRLIEASLLRVQPGLVEIELPYRRDLPPQHDYLHAGISTIIGDSAGGNAAFSLMPPGVSADPPSATLRQAVPQDASEDSGSHRDQLLREVVVGVVELGSVES